MLGQDKSINSKMSTETSSHDDSIMIGKMLLRFRHCLKTRGLTEMDKSVLDQTWINHEPYVPRVPFEGVPKLVTKPPPRRKTCMSHGLVKIDLTGDFEKDIDSIKEEANKTADFLIGFHSNMGKKERMWYYIRNWKISSDHTRLVFDIGYPLNLDMYEMLEKIYSGELITIEKSLQMI